MQISLVCTFSRNIPNLQGKVIRNIQNKLEKRALKSDLKSTVKEESEPIDFNSIGNELKIDAPELFKRSFSQVTFWLWQTQIPFPFCIIIAIV